ncbi:MAG: hypothetical protein OXH15_17045 [Gammaproteobacteria bacterium]|nr:hypothetical protein [Gammaproteobacteria bacterium]
MAHGTPFTVRVCCASMTETDIDKLLAAMNGGSYMSRCDAIRALCPCRNNSVRDLAVWAEIFRKAQEGGFRERDQAAHAIGTLMDKAAAAGARSSTCGPRRNSPIGSTTTLVSQDAPALRPTTRA